MRIGYISHYENIISLKPLNLNSLEYEFYKIDFGNFFHSIQLPNKVTFTVDTDYTILPYKYFIKFILGFSPGAKPIKDG